MPTKHRLHQSRHTEGHEKRNQQAMLDALLSFHFWS